MENTDLSMAELSQFLLKLVNSERYGGRIVLTDNATAILYDCGVWSDAHSQALSNHFPECEVRILQSSSSLSGFVIAVKLHKGMIAYPWISAALIILCAMLFTGKQMLENV